VKINQIRERNACQDKEASQEVDDILPPLKMSLNVFQFIREEHHEKDQSDQYKRKQDEVKKVQIHLLNPGRVESL
jgi:hypothetical protein